MMQAFTARCNVFSAMRALTTILLTSLFATSFAATSSYTYDDFLAVYERYEEAVAAENERDALKYAKKALNIGIKVFGKDDPNVANLEFNYGYELYDDYKFDKARKHLKKALRGYEAQYGENSPKLIETLVYLIRCAEFKTPSLAGNYAARISKISRENYGEDSEKHAQTLLMLGQELMNVGSKTSKNYLVEAQERVAILAGNDGLGYAYTSFYLGKYYLATDSYEEAIAELDTALTIFDDVGGYDNELEMTTRAFLVRALESADRSEEATRHCLAIGEMSPDRSERDFVPIYRTSPAYPARPRAEYSEGQVLLEFDVDEMGFVRNTTVVDYAGHEDFADAAIETVEAWRYAPRFENGNPVATTGVQHIITFKLVD